jgi:hypothetical protein
MIDVIGALYDPAPEPGGDPIRLWGFHVNITAACLVEHPQLDAKVHQVATLRRVWAGDDPIAPSLTVPLRFNGEAAAREALGDLWPSN